MDVASPRSRRIVSLGLPLVLLVGLSLRLLPVLCHGDSPVLFTDGDSWDYHHIACNLLAGHGYSWDTQPPYTPNLYRLPGLPLILSALYLLTSPSIPAAIVLQAFVATAGIFSTYLLVRRLHFPPGAALTAAAAQALDPVAILYSNLLLTEVYSSLVLLLAALCLCQYYASNRPGWLLGVGGLFAAGIYVHPILLFLPLLLLVFPLLSRANRYWRHLAFALTALAIAWLPAAGWIVRNWYVGDFLGISSVASVNMLKYKAAGVEAELHGTSREVERDRLTRECEVELRPDATAGERFRLWQRRGAEILMAHPLTYAKVHAKGMVVELIGPERDLTTRFLYGAAVLDERGRCTDASIASARENRPNVALEAARYFILGWQGLLCLALLAGAWHLARRRFGLLLMLLIVPLYVLALSGGPEASPRFRVLYLPAFSLVTALGARMLLARRPGSVDSPREAEMMLERGAA